MEFEDDELAGGVEADPDGHRPEEGDGVAPQLAGVRGERSGNLRARLGELRLHLGEKHLDPLGEHGHLLLLDEDGQDLPVLLRLDVEGAVPRLADGPGGDGVDRVELDLRQQSSTWCYLVRICPGQRPFSRLRGIRS